MTMDIFSKFPLGTMIVSIILFTTSGYNSTPELWSPFLILLSGLIVSCVFLIKSDYLLSKLGTSTSFVLTFLSGSMVLCLTSSTLLMFFSFYELSALLILILILGWGYQPERSNSGVYLMLFASLTAVPLFILLTLTLAQANLSFNTMPLANGWGSTELAIFYFLGLLSKFPVFGLHFWLPKAHLEASSGGSMILAAVLLKLGCFGLYRLSGVLSSSFTSFYLMEFWLLGAGAISLICLRQTDMKLVVALSSVSHMSLCGCALLLPSSSSITGVLCVCFAHGLVSASLFLVIGMMYSQSGSRLFMLNTNIVTWAPMLNTLWFLACAFNMGLPPTLNFTGEVLIYATLTHATNWNMILVSLCVILGGIYSMLLFSGPNKSSPPFISMNFKYTHLFTLTYLALFSLAAIPIFLSM